MKKEHYKYISEHFNLERYHQENSPDAWKENGEGQIIISTIKCTEWLDGETYCIREYIGSRPFRLLFLNIPSEPLVKEIIQFIKDTEIMFI